MKLFTSRFPIILASASPRRQAYLDELGLSYTVLVPDGKEEVDHSKSPEANAIRIALEKARKILHTQEEQCTNALIIAADTIVVLDNDNCSDNILDSRYIPTFNKQSYFQGDISLENEPENTCRSGGIEILGKPSSEDEAFLMLKKLAGKKHTVITAVAMILPDKKEVTFCDSTNVIFQNFTDSVLKRYARSGEGLDKAGAYAIQGKGCFLAKRIDGAITTVIGLPVHKLLEQLIEKNIVI